MSLYVKTGTFTGTGSGTIITDVGFAPKLLMVWGAVPATATTFVPRMKSDTMAANASAAMNNTSSGYYTDGNLTFSGKTFVAGGTSTNGFNISGKVYYYLALGGTGCVTGSYVGNATDNRDITGLGIDPDLVIVRTESSTAYAPSYKQTAHGKTTDTSSQFRAAANAANYIQQLITDGFQLGTEIGVNGSAANTYHYIAIQKSGNTDVFNEGSYTGNATDNRNITGLGFDPSFVHIQNSGLGNVVRTLEAGDLASYLNPTNQAANLIQSIITDGFQVGTSNAVNQNAVTIRWFAFKDNAPVEGSPAIMGMMQAAGGFL